MARSANQTIANGFVSMAADLSRFSEGEVLIINSTLKGLENDLVGRLRDNPDITDYTKSRYEAIIRQNRQTIADTYKGIDTHHQTIMTEAAGLNLTGSAQIINNVGFAVDSVVLTPEQLKSMASRVLIEGAPSKAWWSKQSTNLQDNFMQQMRMGYANGETIDQLVDRVRGAATGRKIPVKLPNGKTRRVNEYHGGIMQASTRQAATLVRTSIAQISADARMEFYKSISDLLLGVAWVATLDSRTSLLCSSRDSLMWDLDGNPLGGHDMDFLGGVPAHFGCRSILCPVLRSYQELLDDNKTAKLLDGYTGTRASLDGQVAANTTFDDWFNGLSEAAQKSYLGPRKWEIWKANGLTMAQMVNQFGNPLTLEQLVKAYGGKAPIKTKLVNKIMQAAATKAIEQTVLNSVATQNAIDAAEVAVTPVLQTVANRKQLSEQLLSFSRPYLKASDGIGSVEFTRSGRFRGRTVPQTGAIYINQAHAYDLLDGWNNLARNMSMTRSQEDILRTFWHELLHNQQVAAIGITRLFLPLSARETAFSELVVEYTARNTYTDFLIRINPKFKSKWAGEISKGNASGYTDAVNSFVKFADSVGISEQQLLPKFKSLINNTSHKEYELELANWFNTTANVQKAKAAGIMNLGDWFVAFNKPLSGLIRGRK